MIKIDFRKIPHCCGVYLFKKGKEVLYVGKAKDLKNRLKDYRTPMSLKIQELIKEATDLEILPTSSEAEAILKEAELIKKFQPKYNTLLRDDSRYFYLGFTDEKLPKIFITHQPEKNQKAHYLGPFTEGRALKEILKIIRSFAPFCTCLSPHYRNCINAEMGLCFGWCCRKDVEVSQEQIDLYSQSIKIVKQSLKGDLQKLKKQLLEELKKALEKDDLVKGERLKNQISAINKILEQKELIREETFKHKIQKTYRILEEIKNLLKLKTVPFRIEVYDISNFQEKWAVGSMVVFENGIPAKTFFRKFKIKKTKGPNDPEMLKEIIKRRLSHQEWGYPDLIIVDGGLSQVRKAKEALEERKLNIPVFGFIKPKTQLISANKKIIELKNSPATILNFFKLLNKSAHKFAIAYHRKLRAQQLQAS